jgi:hypothetical protein
MLFLRQLSCPVAAPRVCFCGTWDAGRCVGTPCRPALPKPLPKRHRAPGGARDGPCSGPGCPGKRGTDAAACLDRRPRPPGTWRLPHPSVTVPVHHGAVLVDRPERLVHHLGGHLVVGRQAAEHREQLREPPRVGELAPERPAGAVGAQIGTCPVPVGDQGTASHPGLGGLANASRVPGDQGVLERTWSKTPGRTITDGRRRDRKVAEILAFARATRSLLHLRARVF